MNTNIYFTVKAEKKFDDEIKEHEIDFMLQYDETGKCIDGESRNPCNTWTNYTNWHQGWSEQDDDLETLLAAIREYSTTMELEEMVAEFEITDINYENIVEYECNDYVDGLFKFTIICYDIECVEDQ